MTTGMQVPTGSMALGIPAKLRDGGDDLEATIRAGMHSYVDRGPRYRAELRRLA